LQQSRAQLERLSRQTLELAAQVSDTQAALEASEQRNRAQSARIEELEQHLAELPPADPAQPLRAALFANLAESLPPSPVYGIVDRHLLVAADPVFVFGKALLGAEGRDRLAPLAAALAAALRQLPADQAWRLRVEGHTDARPLRTNPRFPSNWELSAARAVALVRYLEEFGIPAERLSAVALAATRPLEAGDSSADHRRNRRLELHLVSE
jgi:chemotaxis protein MotB